jgi:hypothetical protein
MEKSVKDSEETVVMGLQALKALGDSLMCIALAGDDAVLDKDSLKSLGVLIFDKADEVFEALKGWVL